MVVTMAASMFGNYGKFTEAALQRCFYKKVFGKYLANLREVTSNALVTMVHIMRVVMDGAKWIMPRSI